MRIIVEQSEHDSAWTAWYQNRCEVGFGGDCVEVALSRLLQNYRLPEHEPATIQHIADDSTETRRAFVIEADT